MDAIAQSELERILVDRGIPLESQILLKEEYALMSDDYVTLDLPEDFSRFLGTLKMTDYNVKDNNCVNFSLLAVAFANIINHETLTPNKPEGGADLGLFGYHISNENGFMSEHVGEDHAITIWVFRNLNEDKFEVKFWEPQLRQEVTLTDEEIKSCTICLFP